MPAWPEPEWNDDAVELRRFRPGIPLLSSISLLGCQSIGCMRPSKLEDLPNFHLRMMVQMMMEPPTLVAMTMRTMRAACVIPVEEEDKVDGVALALALEEAVLVTSMTDWEVGEPACAGASGVASGLD